MHVLLPYKEVHIRPLLACKLDYTTMCIIIVQGVFNVSGEAGTLRLALQWHTTIHAVAVIIIQ